MKIWFDENKEAPKGYTWIKSIDGLETFITAFDERINKLIRLCEENPLSRVDIPKIEVISIGDNENVLNWLKKTGKVYPIHIHILEPKAVMNMKKIIRENGWKEEYYGF